MIASYQVPNFYLLIFRERETHINLLFHLFVHSLVDSFFKKRFYLLIFREGEGREKARERNISVWLPFMWPPLRTWPVTQVCALTGNRTGDPLVLSLCSISQGHWLILICAVTED